MSSKNKPRKPKVKITKKKIETTKHSTILLTINPNDHNIAQKLADVIDELYNSQDVFKYLKFINGSESDIVDFNLDIGVVEYTEDGRPHVHILFDIEHRARINLNMPLIKEDLTKKLGVPTYCWYKLEPNYKQRLTNYIHKTA